MVSATESPSCLTTNLGWLIATVDHAYGTAVAAALAPLGVGSRGTCVLSSAAQGEFTQTQLAASIGLDKTTMVVTVDELERLGLAERQPAAHDRRARVIAVTAAGHAKLAEAQAIIDRVQAEVLSTLPDHERDALLSGLRRLACGPLAAAPDCQSPRRRRESRAPSVTLP